MLPPFIIDQIRQREERERLRREQSQPRLELPIDADPPPRGPPRGPCPGGEEDEDETDRGVVIVDLMG